MLQNNKGELIPSDDVRVSNIRANASKSNDGSSTSEGYSAGVTVGDRKASVSPSMFSNKNTNEIKFDDGVILNQEGKTIGFAINGEVVLNDGVRVRGGIEKTTNSYNGKAVYKGEVIDGFAGSSVGRGANVGFTAGKLNLDYSQQEQEGSPKYEKLSGRYDLGKDSNITGDIDSEKNINVTYNKRFAKGGNVEQMTKLLGDGGMMDDSGEQVNGVEVPVGSLKEEVADDIPAQLSEGEFVVPADVVRFIGLEKLMQLRDKAKEGLRRMEEMGQMGNAEEVVNPDQSFMQDDEDFGSEIDDIMAEDEPTDTMAEESPMPAGFARGGYASGTDLTKASQNPAVDVRYFKNADGKVMFITHINGVPLVSIPDGFTETQDTYEQLIGNEADKKAAEEEVKKAEEIKRLAALGSGVPIQRDSGGNYERSSPSTPDVNPNDFSTSFTIDKNGVATAIKNPVSKNIIGLIAVVNPPIAVLVKAGSKLKEYTNEQDADKWNAATKYFDKDANDWVALTENNGQAFTMKGKSVNVTDSPQQQNDNLAEEAAAAQTFGINDTAKARADRQGSPYSGPVSPARESASRQAAAEKEAKDSADAKRDFQNKERERAATASRAAAAEASRAAAAEASRAAAARAAEIARQGGSGGGGGSSPYGGSTGSNVGTSNPNPYSSSRSGGESYGGGQDDAGGYSMGDAKGGFISPKAAAKRKEKAATKGLASKRK